MASRIAARNLLSVLSVATRAAAGATPLVRLRCLSYNVHKFRSLPTRVGFNGKMPGLASVSPCRYYGDDSGMTLRELEDRVINVLQLFDKVDPDKVTLDSHFINDLGLDSLDVVEIVMAFEDEFGVEIDDDQAEKLLTPMDAVEFIKKEMDIH